MQVDNHADGCTPDNLHSVVAELTAKISDIQTVVFALQASHGNREQPSVLDNGDAMSPARRSHTKLDLQKHIKKMINDRRRRERYFPPDMFADPAWDMLLDLYLNRLNGNVVSVSSLCIASAIPATTALRWIKSMTDNGYFERSADPDDGRRIYVHLSAMALEKMNGYFETETIS